ncbi:transforming acidic coiled-coil-containing protein 3-like [Gigantopelta aegis]|uniref:transforming acidic coiled-coil-containing protein 3-like n=1 Tax=Gigantopelta aegis TaxID=1735272 RepID=UPI001B88B2B6|nr:transforming acidic coiled-coil-containing protein 3-like [Gigantopelta aegis]
MSDPEIENTSPPLPSRGAYSFNFDDVDEFSNPFQSSRALSNSPPKASTGNNPFKGKSKLSRSPPGSSLSVNEKTEHDIVVNNNESSTPTPLDAPDSNSNQDTTINNEESSVNQDTTINNKEASINQDTTINNKEASINQDTTINNKEASIPKPSVTQDSKSCQDTTINNNESSMPTPNVTPDSKSSISEFESSPQAYFSAVDVIEEETSGLGQSVVSVESEDVWCDAEETVGSSGVGEASLAGDNSKSSQPQTAHSNPIPSQKGADSSKTGCENPPLSDVANKDDVKKSPKKSQEEARHSKKSPGKKPAKDKNSGQAVEAGAEIGEREEKEVGSSKSEDVKEIEVEVKKSVGKGKKTPLKVKDKAVVKRDGAEGKRSPGKGSNIGKEDQTVEEKDTDTKLQDMTVAENQEAVTQDKVVSETETTKKKTTPVAVKKKPKSKLKKPASSNEQVDGDIQIFAPPKPISAVDTVQQLDPAPAHANQMTASLGMVHEFGTGDDAEMPEEANEGFVPASEVFTDSTAWDVLEGGDGDLKTLGPGRESLFVTHDPLVQGLTGDTESSKRKGQRSGSELPDEASTTSPDDVLTASSKSSGGGRQAKVRHPAARVLDEKIDAAAAAAGEPHELNGEQLTQGKSAMTGDSKDAVVHLVQDKKGGEQVLKYSQSDWNKKQQDLELEFHAQLLSKEKEWSKKLADRDKRISNLDEQTRHARQTNEDMRMVITEFEKTISLLQADKEKNSTASQQSLQEVIRERDQASEDLHSVEAAFAGLHQRYEKTKAIIDGFKQNESVLKKCLEEAQAKLKKSEDKLLQLKKQAEDKFEKVSMELDKERRTHSSEIARLQAAVKKSEIQIQGLEMSLQQKIQENQELTSICDELIAKVGVE